MKAGLNPTHVWANETEPDYHIITYGTPLVSFLRISLNGVSVMNARAYFGDETSGTAYTSFLDIKEPCKVKNHSFNVFGQRISMNNNNYLKVSKSKLEKRERKVKLVRFSNLTGLYSGHQCVYVGNGFIHYMI